MADRIPLIINPSANQIQELPLSDALLIHAGAGKGLEFTNNPGGGSGDLASITYEVVSGESTKLKIAVENDGSGANQDNIELSTPVGASVDVTSNLSVGGQLNLTGTSSTGDSDITMSGGSDAIAVVTCRGTVSNSSRLAIDCRNNADNGDLRVADFTVGASNKIEFRSFGEISAVQPTCLLTNVTNVTNFNSNNNDDAIGFDTITTNVGCTVGNATNAAARSRITLPSAGIYLVSAMVSGSTSASGGEADSVRFYLRRNGVGGNNVYPPSMETYPRSVFGSDGQEFFFSFTLPLAFNAGDYIEIAMREMNSNAAQATLESGYFSATKLH